MSLLVPAFLAAGGLLALPFLLHLYRRQPRREIVFPTLFFLGAEAVRDSDRYRVAKILLLILRLLAILLIILAFARPYWLLPHSAQNQAIVVVWDNSYSQQAKGRRTAEEAWLHSRLEGLEAPDELGVLVAGPTPTWLAPLSPNLPAGRLAVSALPTGNGKVEYRPALDVAAAALSLAPTHSKQILLVGDGQALSWVSADLKRKLPAGVDLLTPPLSDPPSRQAVLKDLRVERVGVDRVALEAIALGYTPDELRTVSFYDGEALLGISKVTVRKGIPTPIHAILPLAHASQAHAFRATMDPDDLPLDDTAYGNLPSVVSRTVLVAASDRRGADYLTIAMRVVQSDALSSLDPEPLPTRTNWPLDAVALLRGASPFNGDVGHSLDTFIGNGGSAWLLYDGSSEQAAWLRRFGVTVEAEIPASADELHLRDLSLEHPLYAAFSGQNLLPLLQPIFHRGWRLTGGSLEPLARWPDGSIAIASLSTGSGTLLITGFDESRTVSDFAVDVGFVPFVHSAIVWLSDSAQKSSQSTLVGQTITLPGSGTWSGLIGPAAGSRQTVQDAITPEAPGVYVFTQRTSTRYYSVNLDTSESNLAPWANANQLSTLVSREPPKVMPPVTASAARATAVAERDAWWWLMVAAILALVAEQVVANRLAEQ